MSEEIHERPGTLKGYIVGFLLSLILTLMAYVIVRVDFFERKVIFATIAGLGCLQALIQLILFLHLGQEERPRWNLLVFLFMLMVLSIIVGGSLWIMYSLDSRVMPMME